MVLLPNVNQIWAGDILLTFNAESDDRKGAKQSRLITAATGGRFSHALVCSSPPTFVEAIGTGVSTLSLARCFAHDLANVRVLRYPDAEVASQAAKLVQLEIGRDYSIARAVLSVFPSQTLARIEDHGIFCSALVAQVFVNAGSVIFQKTPVDRTTPATIDSLDGLKDITSVVFRAGLAPSNVEAMSALDGDRIPTLSARQTALSSKCAKALFPAADRLAMAFPEVGLAVTPTFYGLLHYVVEAIDRVTDLPHDRRDAFLTQLADIDRALALFIEEGEMAALLREIASEDDRAIMRELMKSFEHDADIDVVAMRNYLDAGRIQLAQRQDAIERWERRIVDRSAAMRAYLPIDKAAAEAIRLRNIAFEEILGRLGA